MPSILVHPDDLIRIDAATNGALDNVRDIVEAVKYRPAFSAMKVVIIRNPGAMTLGAANALHKSLDASHVLFILEADDGAGATGEEYAARTVRAREERK